MGRSGRKFKKHLSSVNKFERKKIKKGKEKRTSFFVVFLLLLFFLLYIATKFSLVSISHAYESCNVLFINVVL